MKPGDKWARNNRCFQHPGASSSSASPLTRTRGSNPQAFAGTRTQCSSSGIRQGFLSNDPGRSRTCNERFLRPPPLPIGLRSRVAATRDAESSTQAEGLRVGFEPTVCQCTPGCIRCFCCVPFNLGRRTRTSDFVLPRHALCQLSYTQEMCRRQVVARRTERALPFELPPQQFIQTERTGFEPVTSWSQTM